MGSLSATSNTFNGYL
jgi:chitinase